MGRAWDWGWQKGITRYTFLSAFALRLRTPSAPYCRFLCRREPKSFHNQLSHSKTGQNRKAKDTKLLNLLKYSPRAYLIMSCCRKCPKDQKPPKSQEAPKNSYTRSSQMGWWPGHSLAHISAPVMTTVSTDSKKPTAERCETIILSRKKVPSPPVPEPVTCSDIIHPLQHSHPSTEYSDACYLHNSNPGFFFLSHQ